MDYIEITAKTVEDAITEASLKLETTSDKIEYEIIEKGSSGFLGFNSKPAKIKVRKKGRSTNNVKDFIEKILSYMNIDAEVILNMNEQERVMDIELKGEGMGLLIGKRGQTLDSLQYIISLVVNKETDNYIRVKLDAENYRERRKETLENLAKHIAFKVKKTRRPYKFEAMNPYERRIIHAALQNENNIETHSEGEEPYRRVIVTLKK